MVSPKPAEPTPPRPSAACSVRDLRRQRPSQQQRARDPRHSPNSSVSRMAQRRGSSEVGGRRASRSPGCGYANETLLGSSPDGNHSTALAMVLPKTLRGLSGLDGSIDPDGRRGFAVVLAVLTNDNPSRIGPLHDLGMVDLPHQLRVSCSPTALPSATLAMFRYGLPHGPRGPGRTRRSRELDPNVRAFRGECPLRRNRGQLWADQAALRLRAFPVVEEVGPSEVHHLVLQCELRPPYLHQPSGGNQRRVGGQNPLGRGRRPKIVDHVDPNVGVEAQRTKLIDEFSAPDLEMAVERCRIGRVGYSNTTRGLDTLQRLDVEGHATRSARDHRDAGDAPGL